jgi:hypothetical protein
MRLEFAAVVLLIAVASAASAQRGADLHYRRRSRPGPGAELGNRNRAQESAGSLRRLH